jgi:hypothetical protein
MLTKAQLLEPLAKLRTDQVIVATMGVVRLWGRMSNSDFDFASADSELGAGDAVKCGVQDDRVDPYPAASLWYRL